MHHSCCCISIATDAEPIRARRITCQAADSSASSHQHHQRGLTRALPFRHAASFTSPSSSSSSSLPPSQLTRSLAWIIAHFNCLLILTLLLASTFNLPLLVSAAASSGSSSSTANSKGNTKSTSASSATTTGAANTLLPGSVQKAIASMLSDDTLMPHILMVSLPWRGHVMPLVNLGRRLLERGFHVTLAVAIEESYEWIADTGIGSIVAGDFDKCYQIQRHRERQPSFATTMPMSSVNMTLQSIVRPGASLVDLHNPPSFAWQAIQSNNLSAPISDAFTPSSHSSPNGVSLLMRTFAEFQQCMYHNLKKNTLDLMSPARYNAIHDSLVAKQKQEWKAWYETAVIDHFIANPVLTSPNLDKQLEEDLRKRTAALFPPIKKVGPPQLMIIDRFTFAGFDVAKELNISYIVNNPHVLLDLDSPSWSLPAPWSYLPSAPPLSLSARLYNVAHRIDYRATMLRSLGLINYNRARVDLPPIHSWSDYYDEKLILTNTIWGIELHRSADSQGLHSHRNVHPHLNGHTPRFRMTGPLLPVGNSTIFNPSAIGARALPSYNFFLDKSLVRFIQRTQKEARRLIYVNVGDGDDLTNYDVNVIFSALQRLRKSFSVVWSLPDKNINTFESLVIGIHTSAATNNTWFHHTFFLPQFEFLSNYAERIDLVITHGSMANIQESIAAGIPVLILPHPYVDQYEVASRFAGTGAAFVLHRVQLSEENLRNTIQRMTQDDSYAGPARYISPLFLPSSSSGTIDTCRLIELVYRLNGSISHLLASSPTSQHETDDPLFMYGQPWDIYLLFTIVIAVIVFSIKQMFYILTQIWHGQEKKWS